MMVLVFARSVSMSRGELNDLKKKCCDKMCCCSKSATLRRRRGPAPWGGLRRRRVCAGAGPIEPEAVRPGRARREDLGPKGSPRWLSLEPIHVGRGTELARSVSREVPRRCSGRGPTRPTGGLRLAPAGGGPGSRTQATGHPARAGCLVACSEPGRRYSSGIGYEARTPHRQARCARGRCRSSSVRTPGSPASSSRPRPTPARWRRSASS